MKKTIKFFAFILATLMLVSFIPLAAFAEEIETEAENTETDTAEPIEESSSESVEATSEGEISSDTENEETETMVFEFIEEEAPTINPRIVGPGMEDFDPTDPIPDYIQITSSIVPDGVYSLQNIGNTGLWMDIEQSKTDAGYHVQQYAYSDNPAGTLFDRAGLFKISRKSNGLYVIRLMLNNRLSFGFVGNEVITKEIEVVDANVPDTDCFTITYISGSYIIKPYNSSYAISAKNTTASGLSGAPDSYLAKRTAADAGGRAKWQLFKYNRTDRSSSTIYFPSSWKNKGIPVGATGTMHNVTWSTYIGANTPKMRVASGYEGLMSYTWNETNLKTSFTALSVGNVKVQSQVFVGNTDTVKYTSSAFDFQVIPQEGTYLIRNEETEKYIDVKGPNANEGTLIHQWTYSEKESRRWVIEHVSGGEGFVRIKSAYSDKYLAVDSTTNTTIKQTSTLNDYSLWKFERTSAGNLMLVCKALLTKVLALPPDVDNNGTNLTTVTYTNDETCNDEWQIFEDVKFQDLVLDVGETAAIDIQTDFSDDVVVFANYTYSIISGINYIELNTDTGSITALETGVTNIKAINNYNDDIYYNFSVVSDPFDYRCIESVNVVRITGTNPIWWGSGTTSDHTISVVKSKLWSCSYFWARDNINGGVTREYVINADLKNTLNGLEAGYQNHYNIIPILNSVTEEEDIAHATKLKSDELVEKGYFETNSDEYYGVWAYNYTSTANELALWRGIINVSTIAFQTYLRTLAYYSSYLTATSTVNQSISPTQYKTIYSYLDDIDDSISSFNYSNKNVISANERNNVWNSRGYYQDPYLPNSPVIEFTTTTETRFVRVYVTKDKMVGSWMMKAEDIAGLTADQIRDKYSLFETPIRICDVTVPAGTRIYTGIVNPLNGCSGMGIQFDIEGIIPEELFTNDRLLP